MGLDEISKIDFPKPLVQGGVQNLLYNLARKIPGCYIKYDVEKKGTISVIEDALNDNETSLSFSGSIGMIDPSRSIPFKCYPEEPPEKDENGNIHKFYCLRFDVAPYTQLSQVPEEDLTIMNLVRKEAEKYLELL